MNEQDREQMEKILSRLTRIEKAILGDDEHGIWGYKHKLEFYVEKLGSIELKLQDEIQSLDKSTSKAFEQLDARIDQNHDEIIKRKGLESTIAVIATIVGGVLGTILTLLLS